MKLKTLFTQLHKTHVSMRKKCFKEPVGETTFYKRWNNYKNNTRKILRRESKMQQEAISI